MTVKIYEPSGVLYRQEKRTDKQPNHKGHLELSIDQLRQLSDIHKANKEEGIVEHLKVYVSAWENTAKTGLPYISLRATVAPRKQDQDEDKLDEKVKFS